MLRPWEKREEARKLVAEGVDCRRAFKTTQLCALNFTQGL